MGPSQLRTLRELAATPLAEVEERAPEVFAEIQALRVEAVRSQLVEGLAAEAPELRPPLEALDVAAALRAGRDLKDIVLTALAPGEEPEAEPGAVDLAARVEELGAIGRLSDPLDPLLPLREQPLLAGALLQAELAAVGEMAGLTEDTIAAVLTLEVPVAALETPMLGSLVEAGTVTEQEAASFGLAASLYNLLDGDAALAAAVKPQINTIRDLAELPAGTWRETLAAAGVQPPLGTSLDDYAGQLERRVAAVLPTDALLGRLVPHDTDALVDELEAADPARLAAVVNTFPGLGLAELVEEPEPRERAQRIAERIGLVGRFRDANDDVELLELDLAPGSPDVESLRFDGVPAEHRGGVLTALRAYQRMHRLTGDPTASQALLAAGHKGAADIVADGREAFIAGSGLQEGTARRVFDRATNTFADVTTAIGTVLDTTVSGRDWTAVANLAPNVEDYLKGVTGYAELFGSQATCRCEHCQSILSPAAYFVDLIGFVERQVLDVYFSGAAATDELNLKVRRPDLWELPLTCRNTTELVPTLEIINGILEDNLARRVGFTGALSDRAAVEEAVYEDTLSVSRRSFRQPFWLPLERLGVYLAHFERTRADVARALEAPAAVQTQAALNLSKPEYDLIVTADTSATFLRALYGVDFQFAADGSVTPFDAQALLAPMGVSREELGELLATRIVGAGSPQPIEIRAEKTAPDSVQNDIERVRGLTADALDRLHRFARLHARLPWSVGELDLVLAQLGATTIAADTLERIATLRWLQDELGVAPEDLCALVGELPDRPVSADGVSLLDRLFNLPLFVATDGAFPKPTTDFLHPAFRAGPAPDPAASTLHRLLAGLRLDDATLHQLITELARPLGLDPDSGNPSDMAFALSAPNLSLLYRHARLAEQLELSMPELFQLIELAGPGDASTATVHYRRPAGDYDDPALGSWGLHVWGNGLAPGVATTWAAPRPRARIDDYGAAYDVPLADPGRPVNFIVHLPGQSTVPTTQEPGGDRSFVPSRQPEVWLRQGDPAVRFSALVRGLEDLRALLRFHAWLKDSGYSLDDLGLLTGGRVEDPSAYADPVALADDIIAGAAQDDALLFADTVFAFLPDVTEEQSRAIVDANPQRIAVGAGGAACRLQDAFDPAATLTIPASVTVAEQAARALLLAYHYSRVLPTRLAGALGTSPDKAGALLDMAGMTSADSTLAAALRGAGPAQPLADLLAVTVPLAVLFQHEAFDADVLEFIAANPGVFGVTGFAGDLDLAVVRRLSVYAAVATAADADFSTAAEPADPSELRAVLLAFTPANGFAGADQGMLARVLRLERGLAMTVQAAVTLPGNALEALDKLARCAALARHLGVGGDALALMVADDYPSLTRAADAVLGAFRARYADERVLASTLEPFDDRLRDRRRDALVDYLIHAVQPEFTTRNDLYHHFLIDVELEGCARTTRVAAAIGSVQLYVHRVLLDLEQDRRDPGDPAHIRIPPTAIPASEWSWRRNYRVWEANRKVFLYPENYLEPELRDRKSPGFEALEEDLLARPIDDASVLEAYAGYLLGFEEVAKLQIAGSWCDRTNGADTLHLIGVSTTDPPRFYHRTAENLHRALANAQAAATWDAWRAIEVQVPVRSLAPVVHAGRLHLFWTQYTAQPRTEVSDGTNKFPGYEHRMELKYTTLGLDGGWTAPQALALSFAVGASGATVSDPRQPGIPRYSFPPVYYEVDHPEPKLDYGLRGPNWDVYPELVGGTLVLVSRNGVYSSSVDLYNNRVAWSYTGRATGQSSVPLLSSRRPQDNPWVIDLYTGMPPLARTRPNAWANMIIDEARFWYWRRDYTFPNQEPGLPPLQAGLWGERIATVDRNAELRAVNGAPGDGIIQTADEVLLVQPVPTATGGTGYAVGRLSTTVADGLGERLFTQGVDGLLATGHQLSLRERPSTLRPQGPRIVAAPGRDLDYTGANGVYFREIFFHIPFLIANHLNSQGRYAAARRWYRFIFDPHASERLLNDFRAVGCAADGDRLQVVGATSDGGVWHRVRRSTGAWEPAFTDLKAVEGDVGFFTSVDCGAGSGTVHVCGTTSDGRLWHTVQDTGGAWQGGFGDVGLPASGVQFIAVGCASDGLALHVCGVTDGGQLWHRLRNPDRTWTPFSDVIAQTSNPGTFADVTCSAAGGFLDVCARTTDGRLWRARRLPSGSWEGPFEDLRLLAGPVGQFVSSGCAAADSQLEVCGATADGRLWRTTRDQAGTWAPFDDLADDAGDAARPRAVACASGAGALHVCCIGADGRLRHATRRRDGAWRSFDDGLQAERDRVWRYREFRGLEAPRLREILSDRAAIDAYRRDPFNPHAIARLRLSAYQKSIVMKFIDNLLDEGDNLFAQFTAEAVNEATLLYVMAADILGPRPAELGDCGEAAVTPRSYAEIAKLVANGSEFLVEAETLLLTGAPQRKVKLPAETVLTAATVAAAQEATDGGGPANTFRANWTRTLTESWQSVTTGSDFSLENATQLPGHLMPSDSSGIASFGFSLLRQMGPVFCVPPNKELRTYWQRVEDRLYKIRNCQDIAGVRRELAPFAAEIDPRVLVRARAAGISLEDVLNATSGNLPPYRFSYLIDRAKQHASVVQGFGTALLSALEKKDAEELARLRAIHQQNLLTLASQARQWEVDSAQDAIDALTAQKAVAEYRKAHYEKLKNDDLTPWERAQAISRHTASVIYGVEALLGFLSGAFSLIPQLGSPFAMKYGGVELGSSTYRFASALDTTAKIAEAIAASAGLEAGFERRRQDWQHQVELATHDIAVLDKQIEGATLRKQIAAESLALHNRSIEQAEEVFELYKSKFSNLGLYTQLARSLQRLHREAYNGAYAMARLAEQALRFERGDDVGVAVGTSHWDAQRAGLLAGERLHADLMALERRYLETNYRELEIDQAFSLTQIDPAALVQLRQTGECTFQLPEVFFDIFYPGHYRRRIRAVRLTIPSITGPYVNVSATLTLLESHMRADPVLGPANLRPVPRRRSVSIATSTAQADSGVFEMSFRDERYMPFEGQGAISRWQLSLPKTFRPFDYQTINDVILTLSYTAEQDGALRQEVERENATTQGAIHQYLRTNSVRRVFSLRQDFSEAFHRLLHNPIGTPVPIEITDKYFPTFLAGRALTVTAATLAFRPAQGQALTALAVSVKGSSFTAFTLQNALGGLPGTSLGTLFTTGILGRHTIQVDAAGALAPDTPAPGDTSALDERKLLDVLLYIEYRLA